MLKAEQFKREILTPILATFSEDQDLANAYCIIWAVDAYATHMALERDGRSNNASKLEQGFKESLTLKSWQFRLIREASNATKHAIRKANAKDVLKSSDVKPDDGPDWYAFFSGVDGGATIDTDWEFRADDEAFYDAGGKKIEGYNGIGTTIYLSRIIDSAIGAIEAERQHFET